MKRGRAAAFALVALCVSLGAACGREVPAGGEHRPAQGPRVDRRLEPLDFVPGDLDLVLRFDVARMRAGLGPEAVERLARRAAPPEPGEEILEAALRKAEVVWVAMRVSDGMLGDRVLVVEGKLAGLEPDEARFRSEPSAIAGVRIWDRVAPTPRDATARIVASADRLLAFVTPVEVASVSRVLAEGPDEARGDPAATGLVSFDLRVRRFSPGLERKFPSIGSIVAGLVRVRGSVTLDDQGLKLDAEIAARSKEAAEKALRFLSAMRDNVRDPDRLALSAAKLEQVDKTVHVRWTVPAASLRDLLASSDAAP